MSKDNPKANADKKAAANAQRDKRDYEWRVIAKKTSQVIGNSGFVQMLIAVALILIGPIVGVIMQSPKSIIVGTAIGITLLIWVVVFVAVTQLNQTPSPETEFKGVLIPANDASPPNVCERMGPIPPDAVSLFLGRSVAWTTRFPMTVLQVGGQDLIRLGKTEEGLTVSAQVFSADGRIIAELENNEFHINPNNYFRRERPDKSSLEVYDQQGRSVLRVRFLNPNAIRVSGIFIAANHRPVVITEERVDPIFGNSTICVGQCVVAINVP